MSSRMGNRLTIQVLEALLVSAMACCHCKTANAQDGGGLELLPPTDEATADVEPPVENSYSWWTDSGGWFQQPLWEGSIEIGMNGSDGNADALSFRAGGALRRETERNDLAIDVAYAKTEANSVETQHNALVNARWDWKFGDSPWILFNLAALEYDEFKAFDLRFRLTMGLGYHFIKYEKTTLTGRFGAGASKEIGGPDDEWTPEANFGLDFEHHLTDRQKVKGRVDYYPAWNDFADYRVVSELSWEILLDRATNMSLKTGVVDRYDSTPNGLRPNDIDYFMTLIWKL